MKNLLLSTLMICLMATAAVAQVSFAVNAPSPNAGAFEISFATADDGWSVPDMSDPVNLVQGTLCLAQDSSACEPLTNGTDLDGKIAVVYRGVCEFGFKALQAQNEGAIAVIIVNNEAGTIGMLGGASGLEVTIPVIMISDADGAILYDDFSTCGATAIIGTVNGFYGDNLRVAPSGILRPSSYGRVLALSQDASEFSVPTGAWVYNFGQNETQDATLTVTASFNGTEIWTETSSSETIPAGDSVFFDMPVFSQASYAVGNYSIDYSVTSSETDEFPSDNTVPAGFRMDDTYSFGSLTEDGDYTANAYFSLSEPLTPENYCIYFEDPNASRAAVSAFHFSGTVNADFDIAEIDINAVIYEWDDDFDGIATPINNTNEVELEDYTFEEEEEEQTITISFDPAVELVDNVRYLFCLNHEDENLFLGHDNRTDYTTNQDNFELPHAPTFSSSNGADNVNANGFGPANNLALAVQMTSAVSVAENETEVDITPFPNPATEMLTIPFGTELRGLANMTIFTTEGRIVSQQQVNINSGMIQIPVSDLANGNYIFDLQFEDAKTSTFSVVVNR